MTRILLILSNLLAAGLTAAAFLLGGRAWAAVILFLLFCFWLFAFYRRWSWASTLNLFLLYGFVSAAFILNLEPAFLFPSAFLTLAGWDLAGLDERLRLADPDQDTSRLQLRHFLRLGLTLAVGGLLIWAALSLRLELSFEWTAVLSILVAWGLGRLISYLLKKE